MNVGGETIIGAIQQPGDQHAPARATRLAMTSRPEPDPGPDQQADADVEQGLRELLAVAVADPGERAVAEDRVADQVAAGTEASRPGSASEPTVPCTSVRLDSPDIGLAAARCRRPVRGGSRPAARSGATLVSWVSAIAQPWSHVACDGPVRGPGFARRQTRSGQNRTFRPSSSPRLLGTISVNSTRGFRVTSDAPTGKT